jgi:methyl-accepting chemotaxis protein
VRNPVATTSRPPERRRSRLIIERNFQYKLTLRVCLVASGIFVAFGGALLFLIKMNYEMLIQNALLQMPEMVSQLQREFRLVSLGVVSAFILMIGVIFTLGLVLTQRLAGPLLAFKRTLREFGEGKVSARISLRLGDEFVPLAEVFNYAMENWENRQKWNENEIRSALNAIASGKPQDAAQKLQNLLGNPAGGDR